MARSDRSVAGIEADSPFSDPEPSDVAERGRTLDGFALEPGCVEGMALQSLDAGTIFKVITQNSAYRVVVLDPVQQRVLVTGGRLFNESIEVRFEGATDGGSALKVGWIGVGLRLEMSIGRQRITTSRVQSVTIESVPPRRSSRLTF